MSWEDRLGDAAYTPAGGDRFTFTYFDLSHELELNGQAYEFPDAEGTLVRRGSTSGRRYPIRAVFHGSDCDLEAEAFVQALTVPGVGKLEHPVYGVVDVEPLGRIRRNDAVVTAANTATVTVTFWDTIGVVYPTSTTEPGAQVDAKIQEFTDTASEEFEDVTDLDEVVEQVPFIGGYMAIQAQVKTNMSDIADTLDEVREAFDAINTSIETGINILIADPLTLAYQTIELVKTPARAASTISTILAAYDDLAAQIIDSVYSDKNDFHGADLYASSYVVAASLAASSAEFDTRAEALEAAEYILDLADAVTNWRDEQFNALGELDIGGTYQKMQETAALTAGLLVELSFSLKQEHTQTLTRAYTMIDLCAELYQAIDDDTLNFFASTNDLSWEEYIEIPKGREIVYYV